MTKSLPSVKKANRSIGALKRAASLIPPETCKLMFNPIVLPHLDYFCMVSGQPVRRKYNTIFKEFKIPLYT